MTAPELPPNASVAGKYTVLSRLGAGGSSSTYHAVASDGREVALKLFDPAIRQRADIMSALEQTYAATNALPADIVVPLLDAGYDPATGAPFSVTERIPFPSLAQLLTQRPLMPDELASILSYVARALDTAHSRQLCHHALKPTNIFVGFAQGYGVRVTDFGAGLARAAVPTHQGYTLAAPWLAPEQVQGTVPAGPGADVFATALVIFFALTGRPYWRSFQGAPDLALWQQELLGPRVSPSARAQELGVSLSSAFDGILGVSIAPDPAQRYRSIGELFAAYEGILKGPMLASATTMAFPAVNVDGAADYPPPPKPMGGLGAPQIPGSPGVPHPPEPAPKYESAVAPYESALAQNQVGGPSTGAYGAPAQPPDAVARPAHETADNRRPSLNKMVPLAVGAAAVIVIGGGIAAAVVMSHKTPSGGDAPMESASASASAPSVPTDNPVATNDKPPEPAAPPETAAHAGDTAAPTDTAAHAEPTLTVSCDPECDEIKVDGKVVEADKPLSLSAGKHTVVGAKAGYTSTTESVTLAADKPVEKKLRLTAVKVATPTPGPGPGPTPPPAGGGNKPKCGKFIKTNCVK